MLGAYLLALMYWRRGGVLVLPSGFFPLVAAAVFAVGGLALVVCTFTGGPFGAPAGPGSFLSGALVALAVAAAYATRAWRRCRPPQMNGPFIWLLAAQRAIHPGRPGRPWTLGRRALMASCQDRR
jgi:hypothetical protein